MLRAVVWSATMRRYRRQQTGGHRINNTSSNSWVSARDPEKHRNPDLSNQSENSRYLPMCAFNNIYPRNLPFLSLFSEKFWALCCSAMSPLRSLSELFPAHGSFKSARWDATVAVDPGYTRSLKIAPIILTVFFLGQTVRYETCRSFGVFVLRTNTFSVFQIVWLELKNSKEDRHIPKGVGVIYLEAAKSCASHALDKFRHNRTFWNSPSRVTRVAFSKE